ncbi:helix-turn-helix domain-containing protein [Yersinia ruckeri]|nr:helix-turn-helix domain-containing protein [Yersinia ruckeri]EKN4207449.1 helix-turn-helix domain-containing protein [Yersinia ruckeri]ELM3747085.1 helix-turn-helix domain-containing protein [Yersinia ruckeri]
MMNMLINKETEVEEYLPTLECMVVYVQPETSDAKLLHSSMIDRCNNVIISPAVIITPSLDELDPLSGSWYITSMPIFSAIEILATLDEAKYKTGTKDNMTHGREIKMSDFITLPMDYVSPETNKLSVSDLLIDEVMGSKNNISPLLAILRKYEAYGMFRYLISQSANGEHIKVEQLSKKYGLSSPYFRFLCRKNFNSSAKKKMMSWRTATAVLLLIESDMSILDVGLSCGYCSASHFTLDIKKNFGLTPSEIRRLEMNLYER